MKEKETNYNQFRTFNLAYMSKKYDNRLIVYEYPQFKETDKYPAKRCWVYYI